VNAPAALQLDLLMVPPDEADDRLDAASTRAFFTMSGRCSGIPECCIASFVAVMVDGARRWPDEADTVATALGYRPCPACRAAGTFVVIRHCPMRPCGCSVLKDLAFVRPRHTREAWLRLAGRSWLEDMEQRP
jgi:hypothetical protein